MANIPWTVALQAAAATRGATLTGVQPLAGDGSERRFFRLLGSPTLVLLYHPNPPGGQVNENDSYFRLGRHLRVKGVPVPEIHAYHREEGWMLLEDLGDISLMEALKRQTGEAHRRFWYHQALEVLIHQQLSGVEGFDPSWCFDTPVVDRPFLQERECGYFVGAFLQGYLGLKNNLAEFAPDFESLLAGALPGGPHYFLHRDFQSRNLFLKDGRLRVIDFQGGRLGPLGYDLAALLIDPYVNLGEAWQREFLEYYLERLKEHLPVDAGAFREQYYHLALCRNLQILGAFGFLTKQRGKPWFETYIPTALQGLRRRLAQRPGQFPALERVVG